MAAAVTSVAFEQQDFVRSDFGLKQMEGQDFGAFKSQRSHSTATTTAETQFGSGSQFLTEEEKAAKKERKKKKKEEKKKREEKKKKKSSKKEKAEGASLTSSSADSRSRGDASNGAPDLSQLRGYGSDLFDKMLIDAGVNSDFGDEFDIDPFQDSNQWDLEEEESKKSSDNEWTSGSRGSSSRHTRATNATAISTQPIGHSPISKPVKGNSKMRISLDFEETPPFDSKEQEDEPVMPSDEDDDSVLSDVSGLTGIFTDLKDIDEDIVEEEDEDEPDMHIIMAQLQAGMAQESAAASTSRRGGLASSLRKANQPKLKSCFTQPSRTTSIQTTANRRGPKPAQNLRFESVQIRCYERILAENPSTILGPSIGIGWRFIERPLQKLDAYEAMRGPPKPSPNLVLTREQREELLTDLGYSAAQIALCIRNNNKVRFQRRQTVSNLSASTLEEKLEGASKVVKMLNPFGRKRS